MTFGFNLYTTSLLVIYFGVGKVEEVIPFLWVERCVVTNTGREC